MPTRESKNGRSPYPMRYEDRCHPREQARTVEAQSKFASFLRSVNRPWAKMSTVSTLLGLLGFWRRFLGQLRRLANQPPGHCGQGNDYLTIPKMVWASVDLFP